MRGQLSPSKIKLHPDSGSKYACLRLFRERYVTKRATFRPSPAMARGTLVHKVLELAAKARVEGLAPLPEADVHELLAYLKVALPQVRGFITGQGLREAREILELAAPIDFSKTVATETRFSVEFDDFDLVGVIDRLDEHAEDTGTHVMIYDYKTAGQVESEDELENDPQTLVYLEAMHRRFNTPNVFMVYDYVSREFKARPVQWTPERSAQALALADKVYHDFEDRKQQEAAGEPLDKVWPGLPGVHCGNCPVRSTCPAYRDVLLSGSCPVCKGVVVEGSTCLHCNGTGAADVPPPDTMKLDVLLSEHKRALNAQNLNEERKKAVAEEIERRMSQGSELQAGGLRGYRVTTPVRELHEPSAIQGVARELGTSIEAVTASVTRVVFDKDKFEELKKNLDDETRARVMKAYEEARVLVTTRSHVRVGKAKSPFGG